MSVIELRLEALGLRLPPAKAPVANYVGTKRSGNLLFVSGRASRLHGEVGSEVDPAAATTAARDTALDLLAIVKQDIGDLDRIVAVERVHGLGPRTCWWRSGAKPGATPGRPRGRRSFRSARRFGSI